MKYTGFSLLGVVSLLAGGVTTLYYSSTVTSKVLDYVADAVPGLSWSSTEGSLSSGITIHDLRYTMPVYGYNPEVQASSAQREVDAIPTLVDVKVPLASFKLQLSCLWHMEVCLEQVRIDSPTVLVATGDEQRWDKYYANAYAEVSDLDASYQQAKLIPPPPSKLPVTIRVKDAVQTNLKLLLGSNIGLAQAAINERLRSGATLPVGIEASVVVEQLGEQVQAVADAVEQVTAQVKEQLQSTSPKSSKEQGATSSSAEPSVASGSKNSSVVATNSVPATSSNTATAPGADVANLLGFKEQRGEVSTLPRNYVANLTENSAQDPEINIAASANNQGLVVIPNSVTRIGEKVELDHPVLSERKRQELQRTLTYRATAADLEVYTGDLEYANYLAQPMAIEYDRIQLGEVVYNSELIQVNQFNLGQLLLQFTKDNAVPAVTEADLQASLGDKAVAQVQATAAQAANDFTAQIKQGAQYFDSVLINKNLAQLLATYFNTVKVGTGYSPAYVQLKDIRPQTLKTDLTPLAPWSLDQANGLTSVDFSQYQQRATAPATRSVTALASGDLVAAETDQALSQAAKDVRLASGRELITALQLPNLQLLPGFEYLVPKSRSFLEGTAALNAIDLNRYLLTSPQLHAPQAGLGMSTPASDISQQIFTQLEFFKQPLTQSLLKDHTQIALPFELYTQEVHLDRFKMLNWAYDSQVVLAQHLKVAELERQAQATREQQATQEATADAAVKSDSADAKAEAMPQDEQDMQETVQIARASNGVPVSSSYAPAAEFKGDEFQLLMSQFQPYLEYTGEFNLHDVVLTGNLTPVQVDLALALAGDVDANLGVLYDQNNTELLVKAAVQINALPGGTTLPVGVNANLEVAGQLQHELTLQLTNRATGANLDLVGQVALDKPYLPLLLKAYVPEYSTGADGVSLNNTYLLAQGPLNNLGVQLNSQVTLQQQRYNLVLNLLHQQPQLLGQAALTVVDKGRALLPFDAQSKFALGLRLNYASSLQASVAVHAQDLNLSSFAPDNLLGRLNTDIGLYAVYNSLHDWSVMLPAHEFTLDLKLPHQKSPSPVEFNGVVLLDSVAMLEVQDFNLAYLQNSANLHGKVNRNLDLTLAINAQNLAPIVPGLNADLTSELQLAQSLAQPQLKGYIDLAGMRYQAGETLITSQGIAADLDLQLQRDLLGFINLAVKPTAVNDFRIEQALLNYQHNGDRPGNIDLALVSNQADLEAQISNVAYLADVQKFTSRLQINQLAVPAAHLGSVKTINPFDIVYEVVPQQATVSPFQLESEYISLALEQPLVYTPERLTAGLAIKNFDLEYVNSYVEKPLGIRGVITGRLGADLNPSNVFAPSNQINLELNLPDLNYFQAIGTDYLDFKATQSKLTGNIQGENLTLNLNSLINQHSDLNTVVHVSNINGARNLSGSVKLDRFSLEVLQTLLDNTQQVSGYFGVDATLGGTLTSPLLYGTAGLYELDVTALELPFEIRKGELVLRFNGNQANVEGLINTDSEPLVLGGIVNWANPADLNAQIAIYSDNLLLKLPDYGSAQLDADAIVEYTQSKVRVRGQLDLHDANVTIQTGSASYEKPSGDVVFAEEYYAEQRAKLAENEQIVANNYVVEGKNAPSIIDVAVSVNLRDRVVFDAFGVNARIGGHLDVVYNNRGTAINGTLSVYQGTIEAYGQSLIVRRGNINFSGVNLIPTIDFMAIRNPEYVQDDVTVGIIAQGLATKPNIGFFSTPQMSQSQQINYLLTGTSSDAGDGEVGLQLFSSSLANSLNVVQQIGETFGIKNLRLSTAKSGLNSQVTLSGTVLNQVRVNYAYGLFSGLTELSASYKLLPQVFLRLSYGLSAALDAVYRKNW